MKDRYIFPCILDYGGNGIEITFPDFPTAITYATYDDEALQNAKTTLAQIIYEMEREGLTIPSPTPISSLRTLEDEDCLYIHIEVWMPPFRDEMDEKSIKKTLTIPNWLNQLAEENKVNFSRILQDALKEYLGVNKRNEHYSSKEEYFLSEVPLSGIPSDHDYLINETKGTAIKIPDNILLIIRNKLRSNQDFLYESVMAANLLSVAIQLRAATDFRGFWKLISFGLDNPLLNDFFSTNEVHDLIDFFLQVPHGYRFTEGNRIWAHAQIGSIITF